MDLQAAAAVWPLAASSGTQQRAAAACLLGVLLAFGMGARVVCGRRHMHRRRGARLAVVAVRSIIKCRHVRMQHRARLGLRNNAHDNVAGAATSTPTHADVRGKPAGQSAEVQANPLRCRQGPHAACPASERQSRDDGSKLRCIGGRPCGMAGMRWPGQPACCPVACSGDACVTRRL